MFHVERRGIEVLARGLTRIGSTVLVCRSLTGGHCYLPGGHVEFGESAVDALRREYLEETGLTIEVGSLLSTVEQRFIQNGKERHELNLVFHVELDASGTDAKPPPVQSLERKIVFEWIPLDRLSQERFVPSVLGARLHALPAWVSSDVRRGNV